MQLLQPMHKLRVARALLSVCSSSHIQLMQQLLPAGIGQCRLGCAAASQCSCCSLFLVMQQLPEMLQVRSELAVDAANGMQQQSCSPRRGMARNVMHSALQPSIATECG
jgi:hypothetical protein